MNSFNKRKKNQNERWFKREKKVYKEIELEYTKKNDG